MFEGLSIWMNIALLTVAAVFVWLSGTRIAEHADTIAARTGIGSAVIGLLLLGGVTSLPEIAVTVTAAWIGNAQLAVNNLFGSIALQVAILAIVDAAIGRQALTSVVPDATVLMQGTLSILLLSIAAAGIVTGDVAFLGIGLWSWACAVAYVAGIAMLSHSADRSAWRPVDFGAAAGNAGWESPKQPEARPDDGPDSALSSIIWRTAGLAAVILVAGFVVSQTSDSIAKQSGLGSSFVGFVLVAATTSLPELSSTLSAARLGNYAMALSNILGTNLLNVGLLFLVDAVADGDPVLDRVGSFAAFGAVLGIVVTSLIVIGLLERRDRTVLRMGVDSLAVLAAYVAGLGILYQLR